MYTTVQQYIPEEVLNGKLKSMHVNRLDIAQYYKTVQKVLLTFDPDLVPDELVGPQLEYLTHALNNAEALMLRKKSGSRLYKFYFSLQTTLTPQYLTLLNRHLTQLFDDSVMEGFYYNKIHGKSYFQPEYYWRRLSYYLRGFNRKIDEIYQIYHDWYHRYPDKTAENFHEYLGLFTQMASFIPNKVPKRILEELDHLRYCISGYYVINQGFERVSPINMEYQVRHHTGEIYPISYQRIQLNYTFTPVKDTTPAFLGDYVMKETKSPLSIKPKKDVKIITKKSRKLTKEQLDELRKNLGVL